MTVVVTGRNSVPPGWPGDALGRRHLLWIPGAAALGFLSSFLFADVWRLPVAVYHLAYFGLAGSFFALYTIRTGLRVSAVIRRRLPLALALGMLGGLVLTRRVLADPLGAGPSGLRFAWDLLWRGLIYGAVDGALLSAFPWLVTWRALGGESAPLGKRVWLTLLALSSALIVTSAYHLGYPDFRGPKLVQANVGNAIASLPTLLSANPLASPLAHAGLHLAAVAHNPESDLFLPPHAPSVASNGRSAERSPQSPIIEFPLRGAWQLFQPPGHPREAFDFVALDATGWRYVSRSWVGYLVGAGPVADWHGWSQLVYAPVDGTVVAASDGEPDRETVNLLRDLVRPILFSPKIASEDIRPFAGNYVIIQSGPVAVLLAHLRRTP
jgi:hypothetical protein